MLRRPLLVVRAAVLAVLFAPAAFANEAVTRAEVDLDGDGKKEVVTLDKGADGAFTLKAGAATVRGQVRGNEVAGFTVEDVDASDKAREVLVHTVGGTDDTHRVVYYALRGGKWRVLGTLNGAGEIRGNAVVLVPQWKGFWSKQEKYVLDKAKLVLRHVPQDVYWVGVEATVKTTFPLQRSRTDATVVANVAPASQLLIVAAALDPKDENRDWYLIKSSTGLMGWVRLRTLADHLADLPWAG